MIPGESSCPDGSEYVWQGGVESFPIPKLTLISREKNTLGGEAFADTIFVIVYRVAAWICIPR